MCDILKNFKTITWPWVYLKHMYAYESNIHISPKDFFQSVTTIGLKSFFLTIACSYL